MGGGLSRGLGELVRNGASRDGAPASCGAQAEGFWPQAAAQGPALLERVPAAVRRRRGASSRGRRAADEEPARSPAGHADREPASLVSEARRRDSSQALGLWIAALSQL